VRSKADAILPHGTKNKKVEKVEKKEKVKSKTRICSEVLVNSLRGIRGVSPEEEKQGYGGKDLHSRG